MKPHARLIALVLTVLILTSAPAALSQTPATSTTNQTTTQSQPQRPITEAELSELVARLERTTAEVRAGRKLIAGYEDEIAKLKKQLEIERKNGYLLTENYFRAIEQLAEARAALKSEREAQALREQQLANLRDENKRLKSQLSAARKREMLVIGAGIIVTILKIAF